jgi:asparagine synthase (glutamine-hydrolysing)
MGHLTASLKRDGQSFRTESDTEVVAALLARYGTDALPLLDGMFALAWMDARQPDRLWLARDRFGEIPLHVHPNPPTAFASELKGLASMGLMVSNTIRLPPGYVAEMTSELFSSRPFASLTVEPLDIPFQQASQTLRGLLRESVAVRLVSNQPMCILLSGGLDSACIAYELKQHYPNLVAYVAVHDPGSQDLHAARLLALSLEIELREVTIPTPTPDDLCETIRQIETPHKAQVEIGWPCLRLAEHILADGFKVVFSGDGADELFGSYPFFKETLTSADWFTARQRLFLRQEGKNFMRANKAFLAFGVEPRLPYLHRPLVEFILGLPRAAATRPGSPKAVLAEAYRGDLPDAILDRPKLAFQTGLGLLEAIKGQVKRPRKLYADCYEKVYGHIGSSQ